MDQKWLEPQPVAEVAVTGQIRVGASAAFWPVPEISTVWQWMDHRVTKYEKALTSSSGLWTVGLFSLRQHQTLAEHGRMMEMHRIPSPSNPPGTRTNYSIMIDSEKTGEG
jgi:hypothetical protein